jgi:hypothetical protein
MVDGKRDIPRKTATVLAFMSLWMLLCLMGCAKSDLTLSGDYQAVFMNNGQVFFGKMENAGSAYPVLKNVFYIRQQANQETKEVKSILIRRGSEWHGPDRMIINASHIAIIEPVGADSQVAKLIKEAEAKPAPK